MFRRRGAGGVAGASLGESRKVIILPALCRRKDCGCGRISGLYQRHRQKRLNFVGMLAFMRVRRVLAISGGIVLMHLLFACWFCSGDDLGSTKIPVLKAGDEIYSNVTVTAATATDIYFTYSGGIGNAKLQSLDPQLQKRFHFDLKKARESEMEEQKVTSKYRLWMSQQTNSHPARAPELAPVVSIEVADPTVEYTYYNNSQSGKPADLGEGVLADTRCVFVCEPEFDVSPVRGSSGGRFLFRVDAVKLSVGLPITIRLPLGVSQKIRDHEEGHRHIDESFYANARKAAERAIKVATSHYLSSDAANLDSAEADVVQRVKMTVRAAYLRYTQNPSRPANVYYDELTDHARNQADSAEAAQKAIERYSVPIPDEATDIASTPENREVENEGQTVTANFRRGVYSTSRVNANVPLVSTRDPQPYISVQTSDEAVQYNDYQPIYDRPLNLEENDQARIDRDFSFEVDFTIHPVAKMNGGRFAFQIDSARISIGLALTVTEPASPTLKLKNHLAGLRHIYEHFYALGPKAAERAGQFVGSGLWIHPTGKDSAAAEAMFLGRAKAAAQTEYWKYTRFAAETAKSYYEHLTDNGEGLADSEQAAEEAIQRSEQHIPDGLIDPTPTGIGMRQ